MKIILLFISKLTNTNSKLTNTNTNTMFKQTISPLCESIRNVHPIIDREDYIERLKLMKDFFDHKDSHGITPLFLSLKYSIINPLLLNLFNYICNYKHQNFTSFDDFNRNMNLVKMHYPSYYDELVEKIKQQIKNVEILKKIPN